MESMMHSCIRIDVQCAQEEVHELSDSFQGMEINCPFRIKSQVATLYTCPLSRAVQYQPTEGKKCSRIVSLILSSWGGKT